jgi:hypothetical protein
MTNPIPTIWIVADPSGNPFRAEVNQHMVGPFAYSNKESALTAAADPETLLAATDEDLSVQELEGTLFFRQLLDIYSDQGSDVLVLNEGLYPLSPQGAYWVDEFRSTGDWVPLFRGLTPGTRINRVLERIADALGIKSVGVVALGSKLNRSREQHTQIEEHVQLKIVPEAPQATSDGFLRGDTTFWVHTEGMARFNRPELEMRGVPAYFIRSAGASLSEWAAFSLDNEIQVGQALRDGGEAVPVRLVATLSPDPYWDDRNGCLCLTPSRVLVPADQHQKTPLLH